MTFSFDPSLPTDADTVRARIGDTVDSGHYLEDETIASVLAGQSVVLLAAAECARLIAARVSHRPMSRKVGDLATTTGDIRARFIALAEELEAEARSNGDGVAPPYFGGASVSEADDQWADTDRPTPTFYLGRKR